MDADAVRKWFSVRTLDAPRDRRHWLREFTDLSRIKPTATIQINENPTRLRTDLIRLQDYTVVIFSSQDARKAEITAGKAMRRRPLAVRTTRRLFATPMSTTTGRITSVIRRRHTVEWSLSTNHGSPCTGQTPYTRYVRA